MWLYWWFDYVHGLRGIIDSMGDSLIIIMCSSIDGWYFSEGKMILLKAINF